MQLACFDVHVVRKSKTLLFFGVMPSNSDALHLPVILDEIPNYVEIYKNDYKFVVRLYSILQKFVVDDR